MIFSTIVYINVKENVSTNFYELSAKITLNSIQLSSTDLKTKKYQILTYVTQNEGRDYIKYIYDLIYIFV